MNRVLIVITALLFFTSCNNIKSDNKKFDTSKAAITATFKTVGKAYINDSVSNSAKEDSDLDESSDTVTIKNNQYILSVENRQTDSLCFVVKKEINGIFKVIMKDPEYRTNNSNLFWSDVNKDGYSDIVWTKEWQNHAYLFNPRIENFVEVGEFHTIDTLKVSNTPILYQNKYPLLYYWNYEKNIDMIKCGEDAGLSENHSELFIIDSDYQKISFATLDNFTTLENNFRDTIECGAQIINCYVPPYYGKYGEYNIWNSGKSVDSFWLAKDKSFYSDSYYAIDSTFITNYWLTNYSNLFKYGQLFKVRREKPIEYYK